MQPECRVDDKRRPKGFRDFNGSWLDYKGRRIVVLQRVGAWPVADTHRKLFGSISRLCIGEAVRAQNKWVLRRIKPLDFQYENKLALPCHQFEDPRLFFNTDNKPAVSAVLHNIAENNISTAVSFDFLRCEFPPVGKNRPPQKQKVFSRISQPGVIEQFACCDSVAEKNWSFFSDPAENALKAVYFFDPFTIVNLQNKKVEVWGMMNDRAKGSRADFLKGSTPPLPAGQNEWWCLTRWSEIDENNRRVYKIAECRFNLKTKKVWISDVVCRSDDLTMAEPAPNNLRCVFPYGCAPGKNGAWEILAGVHNKELWCFSYNNIPDSKMLRAV